MTVAMYSTNPIVSGISFLEKEPNSYECYYDSTQFGTEVVWAESNLI